MLTDETLEQLARQYQSNIYPNILREYYQHAFLQTLYQAREAEHLLFKGGTALRVIYGSPRLSEDLDFSLALVRPSHTGTFMEGEWVRVLADMERMGINVEIGKKSGTTSGGYYGIAKFQMGTWKSVEISINVSARRGERRNSEVDNIAGDFVPTYTVVHLAQYDLVEEKVFGALRERKKPRDFYDLYFMLRKGMLEPKQKRKLSHMKGRIIQDARKINFRGELGAFLPANQQAIIRNFSRTLEAELNRQTGD